MFSFYADTYTCADAEEMPAPSFCEKQDQGIQIFVGIFVSKAGLCWVDLQ